MPTSSLLPSNRRFILRGLTGSVAAAILPQAKAQNTSSGWPQGKAITLLVGYPPGGSTDMVARTVGEALGKRLSATVIWRHDCGAKGGECSA
jgi:tripartite-type tricarboxylate transporter receptor subunit TctC